LTSAGTLQVAKIAVARYRERDEAASRLPAGSGRPRIRFMVCDV